MLQHGDGRLRPNRVRHVRLPESRIRFPSLYEVYGVRKEPADGNVSTLEAVTRSLNILEPEVDTQDILAEFECHLKDLSGSATVQCDMDLSSAKED